MAQPQPAPPPLPAQPQPDPLEEALRAQIGDDPYALRALQRDLLETRRTRLRVLLGCTTWDEHLALAGEIRGLDHALRTIGVALGMNDAA